MRKNKLPEAVEMARTEEEKKEANREAVKKFYKEKCLEFKIRPRKEEGDTIKKYAADHGISAQKLFLEAVRAYMSNESEQGIESSPFCVNLGKDLGERTETMAKAQGVTLEEYVREAVSEQRLRDLRTISAEFGKEKGDSKNHPND